MCRHRTADRAQKPSHEAAPAARSNDQELSSFRQFQQDAGGVPIFDGGGDVDVVGGDLVHGMLQNGLRTLTDHGVVDGGVPAVEA